VADCADLQRPKLGGRCKIASSPLVGVLSCGLILRSHPPSNLISRRETYFVDHLADRRLHVQRHAADSITTGLVGLVPHIRTHASHRCASFTVLWIRNRFPKFATFSRTIRGSLPVKLLGGVHRVDSCCDRWTLRLATCRRHTFVSLAKV
jgi:hypothetical protein